MKLRSFVPPYLLLFVLHLAAFAQSPRIQWSKDVNALNYWAADVDGDRIMEVVLTETNSIKFLNARDGKLKAQIEPPRGYSTFGMAQTGRFDGESTGTAVSFFSPENNTVVIQMYDLRFGRKKWGSKPLSVVSKYAFLSTARLRNRDLEDLIVYDVADGNAHRYATIHVLDGTTGLIRWQKVFNRDEVVDIAPVDIESRGTTALLVQSQDGVIALDYQNGKKKWQLRPPCPLPGGFLTGAGGFRPKQLERTHQVRTVLEDTFFLLWSTEREAIIQAFDISKGKLLWQRALGYPAKYFQLANVDRDKNCEIIFYNPAEATLLIIDGATGVLQLEKPGINPWSGQIAVVDVDGDGINDLLHDSNGRMTACEGSTGKDIFEFAVPSFRPSWNSIDYSNPEHPVFSDFDGDGSPDILFSSRFEYALFDLGSKARKWSLPKAIDPNVDQFPSFRWNVDLDSEEEMLFVDQVYDFANNRYSIRRLMLIDPRAEK